VITTRLDDLVWEDRSWHPATIRHPCSGSNLPWQVFCCIVTSLRRLPIDVWRSEELDRQNSVNSAEVHHAWACITTGLLSQRFLF